MGKEYRRNKGERKYVKLIKKKKKEGERRR
jgi:hypothetical protein